MSRPTERYCINGHDTLVEGGRFPSGTCRECNREYKRAARKGGAMDHPHTCVIPWCERPRLYRDYCGMHREREQRYGHPLTLPLSRAKVPMEPLMAWLEARGKTLKGTFGWGPGDRAVHRPLSVAQADSLACNYLSVNPREVWPEWDSYGWEQPPEGWVEAS